MILFTSNVFIGVLKSPFCAAILGWFIANLLKPVSYKIKTGKWEPRRIVASGGFPSSHSCMVVSLIIAIALKGDWSSNEVAIAATFGFIVMYDAFNVRLHSGRNNATTKSLIKDLSSKGLIDGTKPEYNVELKDVLGHKLHEVVAGGVLGIIIGSVFYLVTK